MEDLGDNIEVRLLFAGFLEINSSVGSNVAGGEEVVGPLSEGGEDSNILSLEGGSLSGESVWGIVVGGLSERGLSVGGEESV